MQGLIERVLILFSLLFAVGSPDLILFLFVGQLTCLFGLRFELFLLL